MNEAADGGVAGKPEVSKYWQDRMGGLVGGLGRMTNRDPNRGNRLAAAVGSYERKRDKGEEGERERLQRETRDILKAMLESNEGVRAVYRGVGEDLSRAERIDWAKLFAYLGGRKLKVGDAEVMVGPMLAIEMINTASGVWVGEQQRRAKKRGGWLTAGVAAVLAAAGVGTAIWNSGGGRGEAAQNPPATQPYEPGTAGPTRTPKPTRTPIPTPPKEPTPLPEQSVARAWQDIVEEFGGYEKDTGGGFSPLGGDSRVVTPEDLRVGSWADFEKSVGKFLATWDKLGTLTEDGGRYVYSNQLSVDPEQATTVIKVERDNGKVIVTVEDRSTAKTPFPNRVVLDPRKGECRMTMRERGWTPTGEAVRDEDNWYVYNLRQMGTSRVCIAQVVSRMTTVIGFNVGPDGEVEVRAVVLDTYWFKPVP